MAQKETSINSGTAGGLIDFTQYLIDRGYAQASAVSPWASAARAVFGKMEGDGWEQLDLREIELDDYLRRFATRYRGEYKQESLASYRSRVERGVEAYKRFLFDGRTPSVRRNRQRRPQPTAPEPTADSGVAPPAPVSSVPQQSGESLIDMPFPLRSGQLAYFRVPRKLHRSDVERMTLLLQSLVIDDPVQIAAGGDQVESDGH